MKPAMRIGRLSPKNSRSISKPLQASFRQTAEDGSGFGPPALRNLFWNLSLSHPSHPVEPNRPGSTRTEARNQNENAYEHKNIGTYDRTKREQWKHPTSRGHEAALFHAKPCPRRSIATAGERSLRR